MLSFRSPCLLFPIACSHNCLDVSANVKVAFNLHAQGITGTDKVGNVTSVSDSVSAPMTVLLQDNFDTEAGGQALLNYTAFANWNVTRGKVDLRGNGVDDTYPGHGLYVDLAGSFSDTSGGSTLTASTSTPRSRISR